MRHITFYSIILIIYFDYWLEMCAFNLCRSFFTWQSFWLIVSHFFLYLFDYNMQELIGRPRVSKFHNHSHRVAIVLLPFDWMVKAEDNKLLKNKCVRQMSNLDQKLRQVPTGHAQQGYWRWCFHCSVPFISVPRFLYILVLCLDAWKSSLTCLV